MSAAIPTSSTASPTTFVPADWTVADLLRHFDVPPHRIRVNPPPGTATEADVLRLADRDGRLFELVDGTLVEKTMGYHESVLAGWILTFINNHLMKDSRGAASGEAGTLRILFDQIRIPDVAFISWERRGRGKLARVPALAPNLAVEVLSEGNTPAEMDRKLREYFEAGTELVWYIDPKTRSARIYASLTSMTLIDENGTLDGAQVLPGLRIPLRELFALADAEGPPH